MNGKELLSQFKSSAWKAPEEVEAFLALDDVAIRFHPEAAVTWDERGSNASRALWTSRHALPIEPTSPRPA